MKKKISIGISCLIIIIVVSFKNENKRVNREDFKLFFEQAHVDGSFVLYQEGKEEWTICNEAQLHEPFLPASTFKICNSLIGLETGVISDENFIIPWDGVKRAVNKWNADHDLKTAFKNSTVWYYQELARRVGQQRMKFWLDKAQYGNTDTSGGIDQFWLTGGLLITPAQQIDFLGRLKNNQLPFSQRSMDIVKKIMIAKDTLGCVLRAKTGWAVKDEKHNTGWYVGYIEKEKEVYYFVTCIQSRGKAEKTFADDRITITNKILKELKIKSW